MGKDKVDTFLIVPTQRVINQLTPGVTSEKKGEIACILKVILFILLLVIIFIWEPHLTAHVEKAMAPLSSMHVGLGSD